MWEGGVDDLPFCCDTGFWKSINIEILEAFSSSKGIHHQELIQKEKVHIGCEKGAQVNILGNKIATQRCPTIIITESKQTINYTCSCYYVHITLLMGLIVRNGVNSKNGVVLITCCFWMNWIQIIT